MLSKQLTSKLKEEQERENQQNPSHLNVAQCDRLIRTVSCKHDTNHAIRKANINVLQTFDDIKLYSVPSPPKPPPTTTTLSDDESGAATTTNGVIFDKNSGNSHHSPSSSSQQQRHSRRGGTNSLASKFSSPGHHSYHLTTHAISRSPVPTASAGGGGTTSSSDIVEINLKDLLDQIVTHVNKNTNVNEWFKLATPSPATTTTTTTHATHDPGHHEFVFDETDSAEQTQDLFESIENALAHIDFNLKRNSDFINELTKLLDTSRAIQQEKQLKKLLKALEDEKANNSLSLSSTLPGSQSQPASPNLRVATVGATLDDKQLEEQRKKQKSKSSFKGFGSFKGRSSSKENRDQANNQTQDAAKSSNNHLGLPPANPTAAAVAVASTAAQQTQKNWSSASQLNTTANELQNQLKLTQVQNHEISNSDYMELEIEVGKISYQLETLSRVWSKLSKARSNATSSGAANNQQQALKFSLEFQSLLGTLNASSLVKELEQSLFKLNWLITSKSGFSEPNWQSTVLSLTPSTIDSFIGVNLLKNYYRYVKYDFVSYKLFTRQLQLIQICAVILHLVCNILGFYKDMTGGCVENARIDNAAVATNLGLLGDSNQALCSFNFSADKFRPISWSANHVTLYNVQATSPDPNLNPMMGKSYVYRATNLSRSSSSRRGGGGGETANQSNANLGRDEQLRQVKSELFMNDLDEFLAQSTLRLNIQASLANRTGYFYIVNQSTGLVLQAVDFTSEFSSLREQIESNQKRIQSSSLKATSAGVRIGGSAPGPSRLPSSVTKGPRFFLMPKISSSASSPTTSPPPPPLPQITTTPQTTSSPPPATSSSLSVETAHDEQLFYYYLINGCIANKVIRSGYCMAASSLNPKSPVTFWPNVKTTNCSWYFNHQDQTIVSGLSDDLVLDYMIIDEPPNQRYAVVIDTRVPNKASQKWTFEFN